MKKNVFLEPRQFLFKLKLPTLAKSLHSPFFQAKDEGRKSAIAETIALMNKMKLEDKERKELADKREEQRKAANPHQQDDNFDNLGMVLISQWLT